MDAKLYLQVALGGNMNFGTLKPLAIEKIMDGYAKHCATEMDKQKLIEAIKQAFLAGEELGRANEKNIYWTTYPEMKPEDGANEYVKKIKASIEQEQKGN